MPFLDLELEWIRAQFPALEQKMNGQSVVFLDGPGGTQVPQSVINAISDYLTRSNANLHGAFATSARTDALVARAREAAADFLGNGDGTERLGFILFGAGNSVGSMLGSEAGFGLASSGPGNDSRSKTLGNSIGEAGVGSDFDSCCFCKSFCSNCFKNS